MQDEQPTPTTSDHRAATIAGLRAMADFLESRPEIPEPQSLRLQYSVIDTYDPRTFQMIRKTDEERIAEVRRVAGLLGIEARMYENGEGVIGEYEVTPDVTYTVHANLTGGAA